MLLENQDGYVAAVGTAQSDEVALSIVIILLHRGCHRILQLAHLHFHERCISMYVVNAVFNREYQEKQT